MAARAHSSTPVHTDGLKFASLIAAASSGGTPVAASPCPPTIDSGSARVVEDRLREYIGVIPRTDLDEALALTVRYFESVRS